MTKNWSRRGNHSKERVQVPWELTRCNRGGVIACSRTVGAPSKGREVEIPIKNDRNRAQNRGNRTKKGKLSGDETGITLPKGERQRIKIPLDRVQWENKKRMWNCFSGRTRKRRIYSEVQELRESRIKIEDDLIYNK